MRFMTIVKGSENLAASGPPPAALFEAIEKLLEEGAKKGTMVSFGGLHPVVGRARRQGGPVRAAAADHLPALHVLGSVTRVHPPDMGADRTAITMRVGFLVQKIVRSLRIPAQGRVVFVGRKHQWRAASPASHQLGRQQFLLVRYL
jgi:hypothetical protein